MKIQIHNIGDWCHLCGKRAAPCVDVWYPENAEHDDTDTKYIRICRVCIGALQATSDDGYDESIKGTDPSGNFAKDDGAARVVPSAVGGMSGDPSVDADWRSSFDNGYAAGARDLMTVLMAPEGFMGQTVVEVTTNSEGDHDLKITRHGLSKRTVV